LIGNEDVDTHAEHKPQHGDGDGVVSSERRSSRLKKRDLDANQSPRTNSQGDEAIVASGKNHDDASKPKPDEKQR
jgi:hypothetical protein